MRILHLNTEKGFRGGEKQTLYLIEGLSKANPETYLICNKGALLQEKARMIIPEKNILEIVMKGEFYIPAIIKIRRFLKDKSIDIIHCHTSHAHTLGYFSSMGLKTKVVVSRRVDFSIYKGRIKLLNKIKYNLMCDKIVAISKKIRDILISDRINESKITTIYSGVNVNRIVKVDSESLRKEFNINDGSIVCVNIAALVPHKGQKYLLESFAKVITKHPEAILIIVGEGKLKKELFDLSDFLGLKSNVIFAGYREDIEELLALADIFLMTSVEEGLCTSILDALSLNKIVVATDAGGIPEIIKDEETGILVKKGDSKSIAEGILKVMDNLSFYKEKFKNGKKYVSNNFSVENMVKGNIAVYKEILQDKEDFLKP